MIRFLKESGHFILFGFLLTFLSSFGQTFLISLYVPELQDSFSISDGEFSTLYAVATLGSAFMLSWLGRFIDEVRLHRYVSAVMLGLIVFLLILSQAPHWILLLVGLFGLRLFGQGLMSHTSITSMARFFEKHRGRAISLASLGHPAGEAVLPIIITTVIAWVGWRYSLVISAAFVVLAWPTVLYFLFQKRGVRQLRLLLPGVKTSWAERKAGSPMRILKSKAFWVIAPSNFASASIGTAIILFQLRMGEVRGWSVAWIAAAFIAYPVASAMSTLIAGYFVDRYSARKLFPIYLVPFMLGLLVFISFRGAWVYPVLVGSIGATNGFGGTVKNAALAELYGINIIGAVRSLFITAMVFSTAIGPVCFGFLIDRGVTFSGLALGSLVFMILITVQSLRIFRLKV